MAATDLLQTGDDGAVRCWWPGGHADYLAYHDDEWGRPVVDDRRLFEKLCLEGFQSGLSWLTILRKRLRFREVFAGFDPAVVARFGDADVERLLGDAGIVRHGGKIRSAVNNAHRALEVIDEHGSLAAHLWGFEPGGQGRDPPAPPDPQATTTPAATALSRDLKRRGWTFVGPTTAHAFMQAVGMVNDHVAGCGWREVCARERAALVRPRRSP